MDARFIIGTNEMSGREERILNRREAFEKIDQIELCPLSRDLSEVIMWQREALIKAGLKDGMTISTHHHFRNGAGRKGLFSFGYQWFEPPSQFVV